MCRRRRRRAYPEEPSSITADVWDIEILNQMFDVAVKPHDSIFIPAVYVLETLPSGTNTLTFQLQLLHLAR